MTAITGDPRPRGGVLRALGCDLGDAGNSCRIFPMKTLLLLSLALASGTLMAQAGRRATAPPKKADQCLLKENINEDITAQVAKFKLVSMPFSVVGLSDQERKMVYKLVEASQFLESIYWRQSDPDRK